MALTAREWILLPEEEQKRRGAELSPHECFLLRTELDYIHFTEEQKRNMSKEEREKFINPPKLSPEESEKRKKEIEAIFQKMIEEAERKKSNNFE